MNNNPRGKVDQRTLIEKLGTPARITALARELGQDWTAGWVDPELLNGLLLGGSWMAEFRGAEKKDDIERGHSVVVDRVSKAGYLVIRDPADATKYEMRREDFLPLWSGIACSLYPVYPT